MRLSKQKREELVAEVLAQIEIDIQEGNTDAIYAMLLDCNKNVLLNFLPTTSAEFLNLA